MKKIPYREICTIFTKSDVVLICVLVAISLTVGFFQLTSEEPQIVQIFKNDTLAGEYDLADDQLIDMKCVVAKIENHKIRIVYSTCPGQHCVHQGSHLPIVCLPNKVVIKVKEQTEKMLITK